jgi:hypothetical protein
MTRKELSEKIGYSELSIQKNFTRILKQVQKNQGLLIIREGKGENTNYILVPYEGQPLPEKIDPRTKLIGQRFGHLTVIEDSGERVYRAIMWKCKCDCGNEKNISTSCLQSGHAKSCGSDNCPYHHYYEDLTGQKFGKLTAIKPTSMKDGTHMYWLCQCECGNIKEVASGHLKKGAIQSCGCITTSIGEANIKKILEENNIQYKEQISFKDLKNIKPLRYDFGIYQDEKLIRLIEFDGIQHFKEQDYFTHDLITTQNNDIIKNKYAKDNNIPLVRIPYWERDKMTLEMLLGKEYLVS